MGENGGSSSPLSHKHDPVSSRDSGAAIVKKSYIFISESDPIGTVILRRDYVPEDFQEREITNNGNMKKMEMK